MLRQHTHLLWPDPQWSTKIN